ncbi:hypothetical protein NP493_53g06012 [Ridgeia piscesae]|uniref:EEF1A lysine methyltransferase 4 n=1 Tax=Ridgeia piscesae TaxID=27915 RepID=A0AAD9PAT7_RIDPI|nr:hypothetical protein NP493_53g06012 [Ridgeia piscesae]
MALPNKNEHYKDKTYWNKRYTTEESYDWFAKYSAFRCHILTTVKKDDRILMLGCGNSSLSEEMYADGFTKITNIDYSPAVIENMRERCCKLSHMDWQVMDITDLQFDNGTFEVVIEKGTLDAMLVSENDPWNISAEGEEMINKILGQVSSVLRPGGRFISITFAQPHFRKPLYAQRRWHWSLETRTFGDGFEYFVYVMVKGGELTTADVTMMSQRNRRHHRPVSPATIDSDDENFLLTNLECVSD